MNNSKKIFREERLVQKDHGVFVGYMTDEFAAQFHPQETIQGREGLK